MVFNIDTLRASQNWRYAFPPATIQQFDNKVKRRLNYPPFDSTSEQHVTPPQSGRDVVLCLSAFR